MTVPVDNLHSDSSSVVPDERHIPLNVKKDDDNIENTNNIDTNNVASENPDAMVDEDDDNFKSEDANEPDDTKDNIRIRLKYLNDDLKLVEGSLHELLGDFKRYNQFFMKKMVIYVLN